MVVVVVTVALKPPTVDIPYQRASLRQGIDEEGRRSGHAVNEDVVAGVDLREGAISEDSGLRVPLVVGHPLRRKRGICRRAVICRGQRPRKTNKKKE